MEESFFNEWERWMDGPLAQLALWRYHLGQAQGGWKKRNGVAIHQPTSTCLLFFFSFWYFNAGQEDGFFRSFLWPPSVSLRASSSVWAEAVAMGRKSEQSTDRHVHWWCGEWKKEVENGNTRKRAQRREWVDKARERLISISVEARRRERESRVWVTWEERERGSWDWSPGVEGVSFLETNQCSCELTTANNNKSMTLWVK